MKLPKFPKNSRLHSVQDVRQKMSKRLARACETMRKLKGNSSDCTRAIGNAEILERLLILHNTELLN